MDTSEGLADPALTRSTPERVIEGLLDAIL
jgi:hypothetical protein